MPAQFRYARSVLIAAPIEAIAAEINDLRRHETWSPFARPDGKTVGLYGGAPGVGQSYGFAGGRSGAGRITIDAVEPGRTGMTLTMLKPMKAVNAVEFSLTPEGEAIRVEWSLSGPLTVFGRLMGLVIDCGALCGRMFGQGLADLKAQLESPDGERLAA